MQRGLKKLTRFQTSAIFYRSKFSLRTWLKPVGYHSFRSSAFATASYRFMPRTPTSEILMTIQAVKQIQVDLTTLAKVVDPIGERLLRLEVQADGSRKD